VPRQEHAEVVGTEPAHQVDEQVTAASAAAFEPDWKLVGEVSEDPPRTLAVRLSDTIAGHNRAVLV